MNSALHILNKLLRYIMTTLLHWNDLLKKQDIILFTSNDYLNFLSIVICMRWHHLSRVNSQSSFQENQTVVNSICTIRWHCTNNLLTTDESFRCDSNAVCEVRTGLRQCYCFEGFSGDGQTCSPVECLSYFNAGYVASGVYSVKPTGWSGTAFEVFCNMDDGGGWTVSGQSVK